MSWSTRLPLTYLAILLIFAIGGPHLSPYDPFALSKQALSPPTPGHIMGTDNLGRDIFSGVMAGASTTLAVGFFTALIAALLGVAVGALSGYFGNVVDVLLM